MAKIIDILILTILFISSILILLFTYYLDKDFYITFSSLLNYCLILLLIYLILMSFLIAYKYHHKNILKKQLKLFEEADYIIDEYKDNPLALAYEKKIYNYKSKELNLIDAQNKWVHDIKIPLSTLNLFIINNYDKIPEEDMKVLETIALDIENNINKKIMLDKIELASDDYKIKELDLESIIKNVVKKFRVNFRLKNINVTLDVDDSKVYSDEKSVQFCLEQLISNALKYCYNDTGIEIKLSNKILEVVNTGLEIDSQDIKRIFERGYTGRNSNNGLEATGLGLYMVKSLLDQLNHGIFIESKDSKTKVMIFF